MNAPIDDCHRISLVMTQRIRDWHACATRIVDTARSVDDLDALSGCFPKDED